ncbi:MAG: HD domain-containing protein [Arcobacteraceae bacterium]|nr:HD domain-containing protein [Arcobacteraceae bacterium]
MQILGANGSKSVTTNLTSFLITDEMVVDCGNLINGLGENIVKIKHILLTHTHFDHIADLPIILDSYYSHFSDTIKIYSIKENIETIKTNIFNNYIWPDFSSISLIDSKEKVIEFVELEYDKTYNIGGVEFTPFENNHMEGSCGYIINDELMITSDTYKCDNIWNILNTKTTINKLVTEVSFPSIYEKLANISKHYTPKILSQELSKLNRDDIKIYVQHIKNGYGDEIKKELMDIDTKIEVLHDYQYINLDSIDNCGVMNYDEQRDLTIKINEQSEHIQRLNEISVALSYERDIHKLLQMILEQAIKYSNSDAGTLYMMSEDGKSLEFKVVITTSLGIKMGGTSSNITWPSLSLYDENGNPNKQMVAVMCAVEGETINIDDVYLSKDYNFVGTKKFDETTGYRSKSMLVIPLKNKDDEVIGVCQLINRQNNYGDIVSYNGHDEFGVSALASQAAVAITNVKLINSLEALLDAFIRSIATAVDAKSPHTGGHVKKVAILADMIAKEINDDDTIYKDVFYDKDTLKEIHISALMHDVGKITTPAHIMDKATKLETLYDRINVIETKFELLKTQMKLQAFEKSLVVDTDILQQIDDDFAFLKLINIGGEFMSGDKIERLNKIAQYEIVLNGKKQNILTDDEVYNLSIKKGTLTPEEIEIMHDHAFISDKMLSELPFPKKLSRVPSIASGHHEKLNGKGYPNGLDAEHLSLETRILAVADIFEALSASDRPYKEAKTMSEIMKIISFMIKDGELDGDLVQFFYDKGLHLQYARENLLPSQLDV